MMRPAIKYWAYRAIFFGVIALSVSLVIVTVTGRQRATARAGAPPAGSRPATSRLVVPPGMPSQDEAPGNSSASSSTGAMDAANAAATGLPASRVRITGVFPFQREVYIHNFGDAAEDLSAWQLVSPRPGGQDRFSIPLGVVLLPGEDLVVLIDEGLNTPDRLHWRAPPEQRVLEAGGDTVSLMNDVDQELSRFTYVRR